MFNSSNGYSLADIAAATGCNNNCNDGWGGDGAAWWIIIFVLFFAFGGWGNGDWGGRGGFYGGQGASSVYEGYVLNNDMSMLSRQLSDGFNSQERKLDFISNGLCDGFYTAAQQVNGINTNIMAGNNAIQTQLADCCCKIQNNIGDVKYAISTTGAEVSRGIERGFADSNYNLATQANGITTAVTNGFCQTNFNAQTNTRDIVDAQNAGTQAILARIDAMESSRKDEKIAELTAMNSDLRLAASQAAQNSYLLNELKPCPQPAYVVPNPYCCNRYSCGNI